MFTLIFCTNRTDYINQQAIPRSRFAIAPYQSNLQAIPRSRFAIALGQSNLQAIPAERFAITPYQSNLRAIALNSKPKHHNMCISKKTWLKNNLIDSTLCHLLITFYKLTSYKSSTISQRNYASCARSYKWIKNKISYFCGC